MSIRPSIQQNLMYPQVKQNKNLSINQPLPITYQIFKNKNQQFTPINKIKNSSFVFDSNSNQGNQFNKQLKYGKKNRKYQKKYNVFADDDNNQLKIVSAESSQDYNEDYRITFSKKLPSSVNGEKGQINKNKRYLQIQSSAPLSNSNYELNFVDSPTVSNSYKQKYLLRQQHGIHPSYKKLPKSKIQNIKQIQVLNTEQSQPYQLVPQNYYVNQELYHQVIKDLQNHNKNIMNQTKKTIENFQIYIEELLKSNAQMESKLLEYQDIIQMLENQKLQILERQKQRQIMMEKILTQRIFTGKQKQNKSESPPSTLINRKQGELQNKKREQYITGLQEQLNKKQQNIKLLQQLIVEKQVIIKNMANFNNSICLQMMELKSKNNFETCAQIENIKQKQKYKDDKQKNYFKINKTQIKEYQTQKNKFINKSISELLERKKQQHNDQHPLLNMQLSQNKTVKLQKNYKKNYQSNNKDQLNIEQIKKLQYDRNCTDSKELHYNYKYLDNKKNQGGKEGSHQKQLNNDQPIIQPQIDNSDQNFSTKNNLRQLLNKNQIQQKQGEVTLKKIEQSLQVLCGKIKNQGQKQKYKQIICNMMKKISKDKNTQPQLNNQGIDNQLGISNGQDNKYQQKPQKLKLQNKKQSNNKLADNQSMTNLVQRNQQILKKIKQIKKKVQNHTKKSMQTSQCIQQSNDENQKISRRQIGNSNLLNEEIHQNEAFELDRINQANTGQYDISLG